MTVQLSTLITSLHCEKSALKLLKSRRIEDIGKMKTINYTYYTTIRKEQNFKNCNFIFQFF